MLGSTCFLLLLPATWLDEFLPHSFATFVFKNCTGPRHHLTSSGWSKLNYVFHGRFFDMCNIFLPSKPKFQGFPQWRTPWWACGRMGHDSTNVQQKGPIWLSKSPSKNGVFSCRIWLFEIQLNSASKGLVASWATSQPGCALGSSSLGKSGIYQFLMVLKLAKMRFQTSAFLEFIQGNICNMQCINVLSVETMTSPFYHITRRQILQETTIFYGKKTLGFLHFTKGEFGRTSGLCPVFNGKATSPTQLPWRPDKWPIMSV